MANPFRHFNHAVAHPWGKRGAELLNLGKDYPQGGLSYVRPRLHRAFMANAHLRDEEAIRRGVARAEFVKKGESLFRPAWPNSPQTPFPFPLCWLGSPPLHPPYLPCLGTGRPSRRRTSFR